MGDVSKDVRKPMELVTEEAKAKTLFMLAKCDGVMFDLFSHVLCGRLLLRNQHQIILNMCSEGVMQHTDGHFIIKRIIRPMEKALVKYVPTREQIEAADGPEKNADGTTDQGGRNLRECKYHPTWTRVVDFFDPPKA